MGFITSAVSWLFGGGGATKVLDVADKLVHTEQERAQEDAKDLESARAMQLASHGSLFDILVDGLARLVRPGVTAWIIGGFMGLWPLPKPDAIGDFWQNVFMLILTFWFGGRAILKDLPSAIKAMRGR